MIRYKVDVIQYLKNCGYTSYRMKREGILSGGTMAKLRDSDTTITLSTLDTICKLTDLDIADIIEYIPD